MTRSKRLNVDGRDKHAPVMIVVTESQRDAWKGCAERAGQSLQEWIAEQLDFCAMAEMVTELRGRSKE